MTLVSGAAIKFQRGIISRIYLQVKRINAALPRPLFQELDGAAPEPFSPVFWSDVQLVDKGVVAVEFKTEAESEHDVANRLVPFTKEPHPAEGRKRQELTEGGARRSRVEFDGSRLLPGKIPHHAEQLRLVVEAGFADQDLRHAIPRFVR